MTGENISFYYGIMVDDSFDFMENIIYCILSVKLSNHIYNKIMKYIERDWMYYDKKLYSMNYQSKNISLFKATNRLTNRVRLMIAYFIKTIHIGYELYYIDENKIAIKLSETKKSIIEKEIEHFYERYCIKNKYRIGYLLYPNDGFELVKY